MQPRKAPIVTDAPSHSERRVMVIGLDCVPARFAFELYRDVMPNLRGLVESGVFGPMRSCEPPITVPAWSAMLSGRDPGELGVYGFQQAVPGTYGKRLAAPSDMQEPRIWHLAGDAGKRVAVLFVPPSYPPEKLNGIQVSCFLTPDADSVHTSPPELGDELRQLFGPYHMDVEEFRTDLKAPLLAELHAMTRQHFDIARHIWSTRTPDLLTMVAIGPDRFHHAFFREIDPLHPAHDPSNPYAHAGREYYALLDQELGKLLALADDQTAVAVVSDHGARPLLGGVCINEWLIERGYLVLHSYPEKVTPFSKLDIDWRRTRAFGEGGYCGRVRINQVGREPQGIVPPHEASLLIQTLCTELLEIRGPAGQPLSHRITLPESYRKQRGLPPDIQIYFGDLDYRAIPSVGHRALHIPGNDSGPDGCNHDWNGIFVLAGPGIRHAPALTDCSLYDVAPTVLGLLGVTAPSDLRGKDLSR